MYGTNPLWFSQTCLTGAMLYCSMASPFCHLGMERLCMLQLKRASLAK